MRPVPPSVSIVLTSTASSFSRTRTSSGAPRLQAEGATDALEEGPEGFYKGHLDRP